MSVEGCTHKGQDESYSTIYGEHNGGSYWSGSRNGRLLNKLAKGYVEREAETEVSESWSKESVPDSVAVGS